MARHRYLAATSWRGLSLTLPGLVLVLIAPVAMLVLSFSAARFPSWPWGGWSLEWYAQFLGNQSLHEAIERSAWVGLVAALISGVLGFPAGYALARIQGSRGLWLVSLFTIPVFIPFLLFGLSFLQVARHVGLARTLLGVSLGHAVIFSPLVVALCYYRCRQLDPKVEYAASELGASQLNIMVKIVGMQIWPTIAASACLVFVLSWDEYVLAWFLSGFDKTYPVHLRNLLESTMSPEVYAAGVLVSSVSVLMVILAERLLSLRASR